MGNKAAIFVEKIRPGTSPRWVPHVKWPWAGLGPPMRCISKIVRIVKEHMWTGKDAHLTRVGLRHKSTKQCPGQAGPRRSTVYRVWGPSAYPLYILGMGS